MIETQIINGLRWLGCSYLHEYRTFASVKRNAPYRYTPCLKGSETKSKVAGKS